jgi:hypothetical protein
MSGNAVKLYLMLHFKACWFGPKRGWVEASFDDMARWCGWSTKTLSRTVEKLEAKPYIEVKRAANQHELSRIKILKYDLEESTSAVDKSVQSRMVGVDCAVDCAADKSVHSKPASSQNTQDLQAPKKLKKLKNQKKGEADAVRRPFDAELRSCPPPPFSRKDKTKLLRERLEAKIKSSGDSYTEWVKHQLSRGRRHPFGDEERRAFEATGYRPDLSSPSLSFDFVYAVVEVYEDNQSKGISPGNLCSKIIDHCQTERGRTDGIGYYWPPDFQEHRDRLRAQECVHERVRTTSEVRA